MTIDANDKRPEKAVGTRENQNEKRPQVEEATVTDATRLSARLIYEVIRRDGEAELERPTVSLIWSGIAAGLLISLSILGETILRAYLGGGDGAGFLIENLGYSFGFLVVVLGRMQLFTENTITTVLPAMSRWSITCLAKMLKLWAIVLAANTLGALSAAAFLALTDVLGPELSDALATLSRHAVGMGPWQSFIGAIPAGVLVAGIVWMMPSARGSAFMIIVAFTWLIGAGNFPHVVAGSVEMGVLLWMQELDPITAVFGFFLPVLAGNIIGGTAIFTLLAWGQVKNEVAQG